MGIIELAAFTPLKPYEIEFVEKLGESIASTISSVRISEKTTKLLRASQVQSEEFSSTGRRVKAEP
jgi:methyl-accepting chemotaxis protein